METIFGKIRSNINMPWVLEHTEKLTKIEIGQTFQDYENAAKYTLDLIKSAGLPNGEIINFPADGKTCYQDKRMPMGWKATKGKLTITKSAEKFDDPVVADFERHPFHLIKGSVSTPPEGIYARIITEQQLVAGQDAKGALVMLDPFTWPRRDIINTILDLGGIGLVTDFLRGRYDTPDAVQWVAASTCASNWHVQYDDRDFISFSVSPKTGDKIRFSAGMGEMVAHVISDGERYIGELPSVTALIPGKKKEELWVLSHLYEPLIDDNSSGVVGSIEMARAIKELSDKGEIPQMEFSLRLVFAMEMYGFAAFAEKFDASPKTVIGGINTDAMPIVKNSNLSIFFAPPSMPFFGNSLLQKICEFYGTKFKPQIVREEPLGYYGDDNFLSDASVGVPTVLLRGDNINLWHNSSQKIDIVCEETFKNCLSIIGSWMASVLTMNSEQLPVAINTAAMSARKNIAAETNRIFDAFLNGNLRDFENEIKDRMEHCLKIESNRIKGFERVEKSPVIDAELKSLEAEVSTQIDYLKKRIDEHDNQISKISSDKWLEYADTIIPERATRGFPFDLENVEKLKKKKLPGGILYDEFSRVISGMDGKKTLQRLIREAEWESNQVFSSSVIKKYISSVSYLARLGYFKAECQKTVNKNDIIKSLQQAGIEKGDLVVVHSSLSSFGIIDGGPKAIIEAFIETVGDEGTLLFPTFTRPYITLGSSLNKGRDFRPFEIDNPAQISVGAISQAAMMYPGAKRSAHPSHSFSAIGKLADECIKYHKETDSPTGSTSPLGKLHEMDAKILAFGCGLGTTTYLHFLEDEMNLPYLDDALCAIRNEDGSVRRVLQPKHLPGHRDFYVKEAAKCKFFTKAIASGLTVKESTLGLSKIQNIEAKQLYDIGMKIVKEDPRIFLCDDEKCLFCSRY